MKKLVSFVFVVFMIMCISMASTVQAQVKPIQLSLWNTIQLEEASTSIHGIRLAIYGENEDIYGVDWGIVLKVNGDMIGWQDSFVNLVDGDLKGLQEGLVNMVGGDVWGWQAGAVNFVNGQTIGLQTGFVNIANDLRGVQLSLVNVANIQYGLQIGLVNINKSGTPHGILPLVNWTF
ncbi:LA_2272 family surface repeat-containing protein [Candidatus Latescibacterota bacterium]